MRNIIILTLCIFSLPAYNQTITPQKVVFIRHGEKGETGDNLSCQGLNRSLQLSAVLHKKFGVFTHIFVPILNEGKTTTHSRMFQTITPYAVRENLPISTKYDESDAAGVAKGIMKQDGTVLLVWEHKNIRKIVKALGIKDDERWDDNDFDSILIITFPMGVPTITRDKEGLNPSASCN